MDPTLNELEQRLAPTRFFRASRSALISLNAVAEVHPLPGGSGEVLLKSGERLGSHSATLSGPVGFTGARRVNELPLDLNLAMSDHDTSVTQTNSISGIRSLTCKHQLSKTFPN
jgi:hypothetical protein